MSRKPTGADAGVAEGACGRGRRRASAGSSIALPVADRDDLWRSTPIGLGKAARALREEQAGVAELVPAVAGGQRGGVGVPDQFGAGDGLQQQQVRGVGLVPPRDQPVDQPRCPAGAEDELQPVAGATRPRGSAALSSARTTVVPIATTRRPLAWVAFTWCAVSAGTRYHSARRSDTPMILPGH